MIQKRLLFSLIATLSLALAIFFRKIALNLNISSLQITILTAIFSAIIFSIYIIFFKPQEIHSVKSIKFKDMRKMSLAGISVIFAYLTGFYGLQLSTSINYSFIIKSNLIFVTFLAYIFLKEKITREKIFLVISFLIGLYLVTTGGKILVPKIGDLLILIAAFFFSVFSILQKDLSSSYRPEIICWLVSINAAVAGILLTLILQINIFFLSGMFFVFLSGVTEVLIMLFQIKTYRIASAAYFVMMTMLIPIINGFLGIIFLHETLNLIQIFGGFILIISGILVQRLKS